MEAIKVPPVQTFRQPACPAKANILPCSPPDMFAETHHQNVTEATTHLPLACVMQLSSLKGTEEGAGAQDETDKKLLKEIQELDKNHDGTIDPTELVAFVKRSMKREVVMGRLKWALVAGAVMLVLMALAVFGVSYAVTVLTRELATAVSLRCWVPGLLVTQMMADAYIHRQRLHYRLFVSSCFSHPCLYQCRTLGGLLLPL
jgi:hypothetical protein